MSVMSDSVQPHRWQPTRLPSLGFSRQEHWSGLPFPSPVHENEKWKWVAQSSLTLRHPMDCSHQAPLSMGFPRQEYWSGLWFLPPGDLLEPETEPSLSPATSELEKGSLPLCHLGSSLSERIRLQSHPFISAFFLHLTHNNMHFPP